MIHKTDTTIYSQSSDASFCVELEASVYIGTNCHDDRHEVELLSIEFPNGKLFTHAKQFNGYAFVMGISETWADMEDEVSSQMELPKLNYWVQGLNV